MKGILPFLFLLFNIAGAQTKTKMPTHWADSIRIKESLDILFIKKQNIPYQDSVIKEAISIAHEARLYSWEIRLLNFWSQQKVSQDDLVQAYTTIQRAIHLAQSDEQIMKSVDYHDAIVQLSLIYFYRNQFDSCIHWARKGQQLSAQQKDYFNQSILTTQEANAVSVNKGDTAIVASLFRKAYQLSQLTATRHDDAMALHNFAYFKKAYPVNDLRASLETLMSIQDFSTNEELEKNLNIPYRRSPFYFRGTHMLMLREMAYGYLYLGDFEQAAFYLEQCSKKQISANNFAYLPRILIEQAFIETYLSPATRIQKLLDSVTSLTRQYHKKEELSTPYLYYVKGWLAEQQAQWSTALQYYKQAIQYSDYGINENQIALFRTYIKSADMYHADSMYSSINANLDSNLIQFYRIYFYKEIPGYYRIKKEGDKALQAQLRYYQLKDSMAGIANYFIASRFEKEFQTKEKDRLLALAKKETQLNQKQLVLRKRQTMILAVGFLLLSLVTLLSIRNYRLKKKQATALEQKNKQIETLIRELHHRVKNNLQVVSGLLSLQSSRLEDGKAREAMDEGRTRVDAMAMIHQRLYMDKDLAAVDIEDYLQNLSLSLANSFGYDAEQVKTKVNLPNRSLDIDMAIPVGLIVNELVTNAFKHAFTNSKDPQVKVSLVQMPDGSMELKVADNGKGIHSKATSSSSFGMKLVHTLVEQLDGQLQMTQDNGTIYRIQIRA